MSHNLVLTFQPHSNQRTGQQLHHDAFRRSLFASGAVFHAQFQNRRSAKTYGLDNTQGPLSVTATMCSK
jgi:hypothetical protein